MNRKKIKNLLNDHICSNCFNNHFNTCPSGRLTQKSDGSGHISVQQRVNCPDNTCEYWKPTLRLSKLKRMMPMIAPSIVPVTPMSKSNSQIFHIKTVPLNLPKS